MKRILLLLCVIVSLSQTAQSQNMGIGLRFGEPTGLTFKKYLGKNALEINIGRSRWFYGRGWYDNHFNYWYEKQKYNYAAYDFLYSRASVPIALQVNYLFHYPIAGVEGLSWYWGVGAQFRFQRYEYSYRYRLPGDNTWYHSYDQSVTDIDLGLDLGVGLEYTFPNAPFSVFLDANLFLELVDYPFYPWGQGGFGVRFNF